jgi:hypothetical protein
VLEDGRIRVVEGDRHETAGRPFRDELRESDASIAERREVPQLRRELRGPDGEMRLPGIADAVVAEDDQVVLPR